MQSRVGIMIRTCIRLNTTFIFCSFILVLFFNSVTCEANNNQVKWKKSCPIKRLCFEHPKELSPMDIQIIDSNAGQFNGKNMTLSYDLGWYASLFDEMTKATITQTVIDGHSAKILVQDNRMALSISKKSEMIRFAMLIEYSEGLELEQGLRIFNSIRLRMK